MNMYARTPEHKQRLKEAYVDMLAGTDNEDFVVTSILGLILDGVHYGNWLWNMPPSVPKIQTVVCPDHGHPHTYGESDESKHDAPLNPRRRRQTRPGQ
jgi:hypothetical protein